MVTKPLCCWDVNDVCNQLSSCSWADPQFKTKVRIHNLDGLSLQELTKEDLRDDFRIMELGTIKTILRNIRSLGQEPRPLAALPHPTSVQEPQHSSIQSCLENNIKKKNSLGKLKEDRRRPASNSAKVVRKYPSSAPMSAPLKSKQPTRSHVVAPEAMSKVKIPPPIRKIDSGSLDFPTLPINIGLGGDVKKNLIRPATALAAYRHQTESPLCTPPPVVTKDIIHRYDGKEEESQEVTINKKYNAGYRSGILELERRYTAVAKLFKIWDTSGSTADQTGYIKLADVQNMCAKHFKWSATDLETKTLCSLKDVQKSGNGRIDEDDFQLFISNLTATRSPSSFDSLLSFLINSVSQASVEIEAKRRSTALRQLFIKWDGDLSGHIETNELLSVLVKYNDWTAQQGKHSAQLILTQRDDDMDGMLSFDEFERIFNSKSSRLGPEEFDYMLFRIHRCVEDSQEDERQGLGETFRPILSDDLEERWIVSTPTTPLLLYGSHVDPSMQIENLACRLKLTVRSYLIQHIKSERVILKELIRWGVGRGSWIYVSIDGDYQNLDRFLRSLGVLLKQQSSYTIHKRFRLWVMITTPYLMRIPRILKFNAILVSLGDIRNKNEIKYQQQCAATSEDADQVLPSKVSFQNQFLFSRKLSNSSLLSGL